MEWTRSETVALATSKCAYCGGLGLKASKGRRRPVPCKCVFREIFRLCLKKYMHCATRAKHLCHVTGEIYGSTGQRRLVWGRKIEEYIADFCLISRRELTAEEWRVFEAHYLQGGDWRRCCVRLKLDKGRFFHAVYRIQSKLGRAFREVAPYALFPLDEYFRNTIRAVRNEPSVWEEHLARVEECETDSARKVVPIRPPLRRPAGPVAPPAPVLPIVPTPQPDAPRAPLSVLPVRVMSQAEGAAPPETSLTPRHGTLASMARPGAASSPAARRTRSVLLPKAA